ncbi:MAG TPA: EAL domain-containing protein, partial [Motiliproteus sp.]
NGETRIFRISGRPCFDAQGHFLGYRGVGRDVTEEITHRRLAKQLRRRLDDALEAITEGLLLFDHNHRLVICNSAFRRAAPGVAHLLQPGLLFTELNRALLETGMVAIPPEQWDSWLTERWQQYLNCNKQLLFPIQGQRWIEVNQYRTQDGGTLIIRRDITQRINAEAQIRTSVERLRAITDHLPSAIYLKDAEGRMLLVSKSYRDFYCDGEDPTGMRVEEFLTPAMAKMALEHDQEAIEARVPVKRIHESDTRAGKRFIVDQTKFPVYDSQGELIGVGGIDIDITAQVESEERQRQATTVFENTQEGIIITDAELAIIAVNPAFTELTGYSEAEVLGQRPSILQSGKHSPEFYAEMWHHLETSGQWCGEIWSQRKGGEIYPEWLSISDVRDDRGELLNYVAVFSDISAAKESEQQLEYLAHHDPLTELPNRLLFMSRLHHALQRARRDSSCMALLFVDLDHFKHINDSLGHAAGDQLLLEVAHRLTSSVREEDTVARLGGDEFTLLLEDLREPKDVEPVLTKLLKRLRRPFNIDGHKLHITGSIGVSLAPQDGDDETTLLRNADTALYKAKERGRNAYQFYTTEFTLQAQRRIELEQQLRDALEQQQFVVYYQPQLDLEQGILIGAEALVRWQHPERGIIAPDQFISLAEETGLIRPLGQWVLEQACQQMKHWQQCGYPIETIAVNFSREELTGGAFVQQIAGVLARTDLKANHLEMEIVESLIMEQSHEVMEALDRLRLMGISLAIDDFGTGYSSLAYLKQLPVTTLKIDRSFVRDIITEPNDAAIVQAVLAMTDSLQLFAIAEGVETAEQARFLRRHGCRQAQGYYFGRPMPAEQFEQLFAHCGEDGKVHLPIICVKE